MWENVCSFVVADSIWRCYYMTMAMTYVYDGDRELRMEYSL